MKFKQRSITPLVALIATMMFTCAGASVGWAGGPHSSLLGLKNYWPDCVGKRCCDDYVRKPKPCATGVTCFECPDYCPKPAPCAYPLKAFCCDDYCPKRLPPVCCPSDKNWQCVPSRLPPVKYK